MWGNQFIALGELLHVTVTTCVYFLSISLERRFLPAYGTRLFTPQPRALVELKMPTCTLIIK